MCKFLSDLTHTADFLVVVLVVDDVIFYLQLGWAFGFLIAGMFS